MHIVVVAHNIRSTYNVGAILRSCDGFGVEKLYTSGYTPYPTQSDDTRLPHLRDKITAQIHKTALGAEIAVPHEHGDINGILQRLQRDEFELVALEQSPTSTPLPDFRPRGDKIALLLGEEVHGISSDLLLRCDSIVEIPMHGSKESFNVSVATGIALYALRALH